MATGLRDPPELRWSPGAKQLNVAAQDLWAADGLTSDYVLHSTETSEGYALAGSDDRIRLYDNVLRLRGEVATAKGVTSLQSGAGEASSLLFTTHRNGTLTGRDLRDPRSHIDFQNPTRVPWLCCSQSSDLNMLAVGSELSGTDASISIYDLRQQSLLHTYSEGHSDDVTDLVFHPDPALGHVLLSCSADGLVNTFDARIADEDDAIATTCQVGASVVGAGWMSSKAASGAMSWTGMFAFTTVETVQLWDVDAQDMLFDAGDVRDICLDPWRSDYIVGLRYSERNGSLHLFAGTQEGSVAIMNLADPKHWQLEHILPASPARGHNDIVRTVTTNEKAGTMLTGGEDGRVCLWSVHG